MLPRLALRVAIASLTLAAPRSAHASITKTYSTIDAVDTLWSPSQREVFAMSKPGKVRFGIGPSNNLGGVGCRITAVAP